MRIKTNSMWRAARAALLPALAWGLLVLGLTLVILAIGAIVLPAQA